MWSSPSFKHIKSCAIWSIYDHFGINIIRDHHILTIILKHIWFNLTLFGPISWHQLMCFNRYIAQIIVSFQIMLVIIVLFTILASTIGQDTALTEAFLKSQLYSDLRDTPIYNERGLESRWQINTAAFGTNVGDLWL